MLTHFRSFVMRQLIVFREVRFDVNEKKLNRDGDTQRKESVSLCTYTKSRDFNDAIGSKCLNGIRQ